MALPADYMSDESDDEWMSFPDDFPLNEGKVKKTNEDELPLIQKLINSILERNLEKTQLILESVTDVNCEFDKSGWTPLMHAVSVGAVKETELLLKHGADPNVHYMLTTPLICLCDSVIFDEDQLCQCFDMIIDAGARINVCDANCMTPLMYASSRGHINLVGRLINVGADLEMTDSDGWTAIFYSANAGDANMVQMLKDAGANLKLIDGKGRSLYDLAILKNYRVIAEIVFKEKKSTVDELQDLLHSDKKSQYEIMMSELPNYKISDFNGFVEDTLNTVVAAGLTNLTSLFMKEKVGFAQFLTNKDEDWRNIGVHMSFDRKRLITCSRHVLHKSWAKDALIKQVNEKFTLFRFVQTLANMVRIVHILLATGYICKVELSKPVSVGNSNETKQMLKNCIVEIKLLKRTIERLKYLVDKINNDLPPDFVGELTVLRVAEILDERKTLNESTQDLILNPVVLKESDLNQFHHTMPLASTWYEMFFKKDTNNVSSVFYMTIWKGELWLAFFMTVTLLAITLWLITFIKFHENNAIIKNKNEIDNGLKRNRKQEVIDTSIMNCFLSVLASILNQGQQFRSSNLSLRIIYLVSILFGLVMVTSFSAILISKLATLKPSLDFSTLDSVAEKQTHILCVSETSIAYKYFKKQDNDEIQEVWAPILNKPPCTVGKEAIVPTKDYCADNTIILESLHNANYMWINEPGSCPVLKLKRRYFFSYISILTKKEFPYTSILSKYLLKLHTAGIVMKLQEQWLPSSQTTALSKINNSELVITFNHIKSLVLAFLGVIFSSIIVLFLEIQFFKYYLKRNIIRIIP